MTQFLIILKTLNLSLKSDKDLKKQIKTLSLLYKSNQALTSVLNIDRILKLVTNNALNITNAIYCSLRLLEEPGKLVRKTFSAKSHIDMKQKLVLNIGESLAGRAMLDKKPVYCENIQKSKVYSVPGEAKRLKLYSLLAIPLLFKGKAVGVLTVYTRRVRTFSRGEYEALAMFANQAALVIENARLFENLKTNYLRTIHALAALIDTKDTYTRGHSEAVMQYACGMAEKLRLNKKDIEIIKYASLLHDLGKIGIKLDILRKPSSLSKTEWKSIEKHSQIGADIIKQVGFLDKLVPIILFHHKWYDGRGYPKDNLKGEDIPVGARIIAVADAFQAMISDRPYRSRRNIDYAKKELKKWTNTQFDPKVVKIFLNMLENNKIIKAPQ
jgi:putative nucleotidyltransferase with HDIG domain